MSTTQDGQVTIMVVGITLMCMAVAGLAIDGTSLMLQRRALQNAADSAALAGASQLDEDVYYRSDGEEIRLDADTARSKAAELLGALPGGSRAAIETSEQKVSVVLSRRIPVTFLGIVGIGPLMVTVRSSAAPIPGSA